METPKRKASPARIAANERWEAKAYDKVLIRFPKGTKERIQDTGETINGYVVRCVLTSLDASEATRANTKPQTDAD